MKQKYRITIADIEMNVISDESPEAVEALVGLVNRKMNDIMGPGRQCPKSEAALLCALDYCSDRIKAQRKLKALESLQKMADGQATKIIIPSELQGLAGMAASAKEFLKD